MKTALVVTKLPNEDPIHCGKIYWVRGNYCTCGAHILQELDRITPFPIYRWRVIPHDCIEYLSRRISQLEKQIKGEDDARTTN